MPPRRSCFRLDMMRGRARDIGFNATTAFLLPGRRGWSWSRITIVSMPPRRSCFPDWYTSLCMRLFRFNATTAFLLPPLQEGPCQTKSGFNATTAFLLLRVVEGRFLDPQTFQCHHGVPASRAMGRLGPWDRSGFNATTAFLLQSLPDNPHSVSSCFNATTAFLLPLDHISCDTLELCVSMPPRRSCFRPLPPLSRQGGAAFQCHHGVPASGSIPCRLLER